MHFFFQFSESDELNINSVIRIHKEKERVQAVNCVTCNNSDNTLCSTIIISKLFHNDGYQCGNVYTKII